MAKSILRVESIHKPQEFDARFKHNYRLREVKNANPEMKELNRTLITLSDGEDYNTFFKRKVAELPYYRNHHLRKNGVIGLEVLMSFGIKGLPECFNLERWAELSIQWLISEFSSENIADAVLHADEGTPHIHAVVVPVHDGKINASHFLPNRQALRDFHKRYFESVRELGLEPESRYISTSHEKVGKFYAEVDVAMQQRLPERKEEETIDDYLDRLNSFYEEEAIKNSVQEHQIKQLKKEKEALEKANRTMSKMLDDRDRDIAERLGSIEHAEQALRFYEGVNSSVRNALQSGDEGAAFANEFIEMLQTLRDYSIKPTEEIIL